MIVLFASVHLIDYKLVVFGKVLCSPDDFLELGVLRLHYGSLKKYINYSIIPKTLITLQGQTLITDSSSINGTDTSLGGLTVMTIDFSIH